MINKKPWDDLATMSKKTRCNFPCKDVYRHMRLKKVYTHHQLEVEANIKWIIVSQCMQYKYLS